MLINISQAVTHTAQSLSHRNTTLTMFFVPFQEVMRIDAWPRVSGSLTQKWTWLPSLNRNETALAIPDTHSRTKDHARATCWYPRSVCSQMWSG